MNHFHVPQTLLFASCALFVGCTTAPTDQRPDATAGPAAVAPARAAQPAAPTASPRAPSTEAGTTARAKPVAPAAVLPPPKLSPEVLALVERLTSALGRDPSHRMAETTSFPEALQSLEQGARAPQAEAVNLSNQPPPEGLTADGSSTQLIVRDWTGLVLVPISTSLSKAYTSEVRLLKVEAHPLNDGRVRVWTRIHNISTRTLPGQVACSFRMRGEPPPTSPYYYNLQVPAGSFRDVFFVSPDGELTNYTVLVRSEDMKTRR